MNGAALYGACLGVVVLTVQAVGSPEAWLVLWLLFAVQLTLCALVVWRRTGMPFATAAYVYGALVCGGIAVAAMTGVPYPEFARAHPLELIAITVVWPFLLVQQYHRDPERWARWHAHIAHCSWLDYLTLRQIPDLRVPANRAS